MPDRDSLSTYKNPLSVGSATDIEAALKAGHSVEPESETQLCANVVGAVPTRSDKSAAFAPRVFVRRCRLWALSPVFLPHEGIDITEREDGWTVTLEQSTLYFDGGWGEVMVLWSWHRSRISSLIIRFDWSSFLLQCSSTRDPI
jgi:hypothetical protein